MTLRKTVNAQSQHNPDPDYACEVVQALRKQGLTTEQIARRAGIHERSIYRATEIGFIKYPIQFTLESLAGLR